MHRLVLPLVAATLLVSACASSYRPADMTGGYSDAQIDRASFRITFKGNVTMKQSETDDLVLLRGAQVALDHGYSYFVSSGPAPVGSAISLATNVVSSPSSTITITCFESRPETTAVVHDARRIVVDHAAYLK